MNFFLPVLITVNFISSSSGACSTQSNKDIQGNDLSAVHGQPVSACCAICRNHNGCVAWSWNDYAGGSCWLKSASSPLVSYSGVTVGTLRNPNPRVPTHRHGWRVLKNYDLSNMDAIRREWNIKQWAPGIVNAELQAYTSNAENLFVRDGTLVIRAIKKSGGITSARIHSKARYTPVKVSGRKLRVEFEAKVPTVMGAWPALWMLGKKGVYGNWPHEGEIDVMEWVWQIQNKFLSTLHWKGTTGWSTEFRQLNMGALATEFTTFGVEYSAVANDEYIQYYIRTQSGKTYLGNLAKPSLWKDSWHPSPSCSALTPGANHCSPLAPFDNEMNIILNLAVGGAWGGCCGVNSYAAFDSGVEMPIKRVTVYEAS